MDFDVRGCEFAAEGGGPLLEEGFAAAVGGEKRGGHDAAKGSHGQDETAFSLNHAWYDELCDSQGAEAVDCDDVFQLFLGRFGEWDGDAVALSHVVDEDGDVELRDEGLQVGKVGVVIGCKVHGVELGLDIVFLLNFGREGLEFGLGAGDEEDVEAFRCELESVFFADTVGGARDDRPAAFFAKLGELVVDQRVVW